MERRLHSRHQAMKAPQADELARNRAAAHDAGLRHVTPYEDPGFTRRRAGKGFVYRDGERRVTRAETLARIRRLAIPPAWTAVWIARDPIGHIQAAGRDARGRLQYRYHDQWRVARDAEKYGRLADFCRALPRLRRRVARDLQCPCLCREAVCATVVALLERGHLRIGNDEYARHNGTYGATTLEVRHLKLRGSHIGLVYKGKSGIVRHIDLDDPELARVLRRVKDLPGRRLLQYVDDGRPRPVSSNEVNAYLRAATGDDFSAKDFRTWAATVWTALALAAIDPPGGERASKRAVAGVIKEVAARLGHTPTVCRKSYVHPRVVDGFALGELRAAFPARLRARAGRADLATLRAAERCVVAILTARPRARRALVAVSQGAAASAA